MPKKPQVYRQHVDKISEQLRSMALFMNDLSVLSKLSSGDVASNELFYHSKCYKTFTNRYSAAKEAAYHSEIFINNENEEFIKALYFNQIISYIYEKKQQMQLFPSIYRNWNALTKGYYFLII